MTNNFNPKPMKIFSILLILSISIAQVEKLNGQRLSRQLLADTVTLWANAKFQTFDDFRKEFVDENTRYHLSRKFENQHIVYNDKGEVVFNYKNFIIKTLKEVENNKSSYFVSLTFWDIILKEDVGTSLNLNEINNIINFFINPENIINLQNEDIVSFENFKIIKSSDRYYLSIKDIHYGDRLTEILYNNNRNEFSLINAKLEKAKSVIEGEIINK